jgi:hypothetical protein
MPDCAGGASVDGGGSGTCGDSGMTGFCVGGGAPTVFSTFPRIGAVSDCCCCEWRGGNCCGAPGAPEGAVAGGPAAEPGAELDAVPGVEAP